MTKILMLTYNPATPRHLGENPSVLDRAITHYGLTANWKDAGYILPDGSMLDFSEGSGYGRTQDHRNVEFPLTKRFEYRTDAMNHFMRITRAIRIMPEVPAFDILVPPTSAQLTRMVAIARESGRPPVVSMDRPRHDRFYREYQPWDLRMMSDDVRTYWDI